MRYEVYEINPFEEEFHDGTETTIAFTKELYDAERIARSHPKSKVRAITKTNTWEWKVKCN